MLNILEGCQVFELPYHLRIHLLLILIIILQLEDFPQARQCRLVIQCFVDKLDEYMSHSDLHQLFDTSIRMQSDSSTYTNILL